MRIASIALKHPSRLITNDGIVALLEECSNGVEPRVLRKYQRLVRGLLKRTGSVTRYVRDEQHGERASDLVEQAMLQALEQASVAPADIDLLIYCGVGKGFLEPANAYFYARAVGLTCSCFDIADACMSWMRALDVAYRFLRAGTLRTAMIINGEFNYKEHGYPENFKVKGIEQLEYTFPTYTIGEAATATIVTASDAEWCFDYHSVPELCGLCNIPLAGYEDFVEASERIALNGVNNFVAYGHELFARAEQYLLPLVRRAVGDLNVPDIYFPHAASSVAYLRAGRAAGIRPGKVYSEVFPRLGNLVSASIPAAMVLAEAEGRLKRGDRVVLVPASAGMVFGVGQFTY